MEIAWTGLLQFPIIQEGGEVRLWYVRKRSRRSRNVS